jgi:hypothetical protein
MKLQRNESGEIIIREAYNGVRLESNQDEYIAICVRDSGFEFNYMGTWYEAKNGIVREMSNKLEKESCTLCGGSGNIIYGGSFGGAEIVCKCPCNSKH